MCKVVVFGGSGFLGSHVCDVLSDRGYDVYIYDIKKSPYLNGNQKMIIGDIMDKDKVEEAVEGAKYVYNFAGIVDIEESQKKPYDTMRLNVMGHLNVLLASVKHNVERVLYGSTVYVYNKRGSFYRVSKQSSEILTEEFNRQYGLKYTILRYGSLYGPRCQEWNSVYKVLKEAVEKGVIHYNGTGEEVREFIHVYDAAKASVDILSDEFVNASVVITGSEVLRYSQLFEIIKEILGYEVEIVYEGKEKVNHYKVTPFNYKPNFAKKLIVNPTVMIGQGLVEMIDEMYKWVRY